MADADVIATTGGALEDAMLQLTYFVKVCDSLDRDSECPLVFVMGNMVREVNVAMEAYLTAVNTRALPLLRDMASLTKANGVTPPAAVQAYADRNGLPPGGMGGVPPMVTKVMAGQSAPSRT
ncbi:hypothetical protein [Hydrogenophaga sp. PBL-H3]|uniref:hypothetical protein n=1 Tax=Hydrogenophaga sp. PBL-H3 TaxID=434010 RepID=UPI00131F6EF5|nr:hypothetical protein [Hydrogenophaga sp. PBL-H3]QHE76546.1 hypothetical protein F9Z45_10980 [Hydrogenophaga sp. PBL-H3]QHE80970.1 hypothetical protein F9Z44_10980 [Hydrogenophaga sp. PBL-H3]